MHDYFISAKIECGIALVGSEVKSLREGRAQLTQAIARVEGKRLVLHGAQIDPYSTAAAAYNHEPTRDRFLLVHKRQLRKLQDELSQKGTTLIPARNRDGRVGGEEPARGAGPTHAGVRAGRGQAARPARRADRPVQQGRRRL